MLASCVAFPALTVLLFQFQVMLHVVHEPVSEGFKTRHMTLIEEKSVCSFLPLHQYNRFEKINQTLGADMVPQNYTIVTKYSVLEVSTSSVKYHFKV